MAVRRILHAAIVCEDTIDKCTFNTRSAVFAVLYTRSIKIASSLGHHMISPFLRGTALHGFGKALAYIVQPTVLRPSLHPSPASSPPRLGCYNQSCPSPLGKARLFVDHSAISHDSPSQLVVVIIARGGP